jgi:hypothetical protein
MVIFSAKIKNDDSSRCPICNRKLIGYGWRDRILIEADGNKETLLIHRLLCTDCEKIHHELPDIIIPYKRHCAKTIVNIIKGKPKDGIICDDNTIRRILAWWKALTVYFSGIIGSLRLKFSAVFSDPPQPKEIVRAVANANLWIPTRSAFSSG